MFCMAQQAKLHVVEDSQGEPAKKEREKGKYETARDCEWLPLQKVSFYLWITASIVSPAVSFADQNFRLIWISVKLANWNIHFKHFTRLFESCVLCSALSKATRLLKQQQQIAEELAQLQEDVQGLTPEEQKELGELLKASIPPASPQDQTLASAGRHRVSQGEPIYPHYRDPLIAEGPVLRSAKLQGLAASGSIFWARTAAEFVVNLWDVRGYVLAETLASLKTAFSVIAIALSHIYTFLVRLYELASHGGQITDLDLFRHKTPYFEELPKIWAWSKPWVTLKTGQSWGKITWGTHTWHTSPFPAQ
jgi:hypothetical protein